jgi:holin-like protein
MPEAVAHTLLCLAAGEIVSRLGLLPVPAPVIGLLLLYVDLSCRGLSDDLGHFADRLLGMLGLLFVPAGVGVITYTDLLRAEWLPVLAGVIGGTFVTLLATLLVAERLAAPRRRRVEPPQPAARSSTLPVEELTGDAHD